MPMPREVRFDTAIAGACLWVESYPLALLTRFGRGRSRELGCRAREAVAGLRRHVTKRSIDPWWRAEFHRIQDARIAAARAEPQDANGSLLRGSFAPWDHRTPTYTAWHTAVSVLGAGCRVFVHSKADWAEFLKAQDYEIENPPSVTVDDTLPPHCWEIR